MVHCQQHVIWKCVLSMCLPASIYRHTAISYACKSTLQYNINFKPNNRQFDACCLLSTVSIHGTYLQTLVSPASVRCQNRGAVSKQATPPARTPKSARGQEKKKTRKKIPAGNRNAHRLIVTLFLAATVLPTIIIRSFPRKRVLPKFTKDFICKEVFLPFWGFRP